MPVAAVFDCILFLQAAVNRDGVAFRCFQLAEEGRVMLALSPSVLAEVRDVLGRPELTSRFRTLTPERSAQFLERVLSFASVHADPPEAFPLPRDPGDQPYTDLAIAARAQFLVTWNERHLTYLMKQDTPEGREFCWRFPGLNILDPVSFVRHVESHP